MGKVKRKQRPQPPRWWTLDNDNQYVLSLLWEGAKIMEKTMWKILLVANLVCIMLCIIFKKFDVAFMNLIAAIMDCLNIFGDE